MTLPDPSLETTRNRAFARLARPLGVTRAGMLAERLARAFWPFATVAMLALGLAMLDVQHADAPRWAMLSLGGAILVGGLVTAGWGLWRLRLPARAEALDRLDRSLPGRPISALGDIQAIGAGDPASRLVWRKHVERMAERAAAARAVAPDLRVSDRDRFGLRLMAATVFLTALVFGSIWRIGGVTDALGPDPATALAGGPAWEGWAEPPSYTGRPSLYLADLDDTEVTLPKGTRITLRLYGEVGALTVTESVSAPDPSPGTEPPANPSAREFDAVQDGTLAIEGPGGRSWSIRVTADAPPVIAADGDIEWAADGELRQRFTATDDYGVIAGTARISLDLGAVDRRYGLAREPEPREALTLDLPMPFTGDRRDVSETLAGNLSEHPWARLPVTIELAAQDALGQTGTAEPVHTTLPGRRFFDPLAKAVIEVRRDLLWSRDNGPSSAQILRAVTYRPEGLVRSATVFLKLRTAIRELEGELSKNAFDGPARDDLAAVLWDIALEIEFGNLNDARARLERAQDRLSEAIENGASDEEIAGLIEELRRAMEEYMRQLAQNQDQDQNQQAQNQQMQQMTGQDLQDMLDRLQELMQQGRMDEAQQLLDQLRQMMQNMQITQGQQGQQGPGQQAMEGLADTLRQQQGLSDEAFRDLQNQFNQGNNPGQQGQNPGQQGEGQQGQNGQGDQNDQQGRPGGQGGDQDLGRTLAERQGALRRELDRQRGQLPGAGTPEGDAARESLGRAGEAMDRAEEDLKSNDLAGALDNQSEAIEALREGMRNLGEMIAQQQMQQNGQGQQTGNANPSGRRDPLGRDEGNSGRLGTDQDLLQGEDVYRRARELLDEIRRREGDKTRPTEELDYLRRLLDRF